MPCGDADRRIGSIAIDAVGRTDAEVQRLVANAGQRRAWRLLVGWDEGRTQRNGGRRRRCWRGAELRRVGEAGEAALRGRLGEGEGLGNGTAPVAGGDAVGGGTDKLRAALDGVHGDDATAIRDRPRMSGRAAERGVTAIAGGAVDAAGGDLIRRSATGQGTADIQRARVAWAGLLRRGSSDEPGQSDDGDAKRRCRTNPHRKLPASSFIVYAGLRRRPIFVAVTDQGKGVNTTWRPSTGSR